MGNTIANNWLKILRISGVVLIVVILFLIILVLHAQSDKQTILQRQLHEDSKALASFSRSSPTSFAQTLESKLNALTTENANLQSTLNSLSNQLNVDTKSLASASSSITAIQTQLANICVPTSISNEQSNLQGEQTVNGSGNTQYYNDLQGIITAVCQ